MRRRALALGLLLLLPTSSCGTAGSPQPASTPTPLPVEEASRPAVEITYPPEGAEPLPAGDILVALTVRSFGIVDEIGSKTKDGVGHVVYYLDVEDIPAEGDAATVEGSGRAKASAQTNHTWKDVAAGRHTLGVQLVNNDGTPLDRPATDTVRIVVGG
jgi:hypothetical protein